MLDSLVSHGSCFPQCLDVLQASIIQFPGAHIPRAKKYENEDGRKRCLQSRCPAPSRNSPAVQIRENNQHGSGAISPTIPRKTGDRVRTHPPLARNHSHFVKQSWLRQGCWVPHICDKTDGPDLCRLQQACPGDARSVHTSESHGQSMAGATVLQYQDVPCTGEDVYLLRLASSVHM